MKPAQKEILAKLDVPHLVAAARQLLAEGKTDEQAILEIIRIIDAIVPWNILVPGPVGMVLEVVDGPIARAVAIHILKKAKAKKP